MPDFVDSLQVKCRFNVRICFLDTRCPSRHRIRSRDASTLADGVAGIPIEARSEAETNHIQGRATSGILRTMPLSGLITERGVTPTIEAGLRVLVDKER